MALKAALLICSLGSSAHLSFAGSLRGTVNTDARQQQPGRKLPPQSLPVPAYEKIFPGLMVVENFEKGAEGWVAECADVAEWVQVGQPGVPPPRTPGTKGMYRFTGANQPLCSSLNFVVPGANFQPGEAYHLAAWVYLPQYDCTDEITSLKCPYLKYQADGIEDGAGTLLTRIPNRWNAMSGTVVSQGGDLTILIKQLPMGTTVYIDDVWLTNCSLDNFRAYSLPKIADLRKRDVALQIGPGIAGQATITMTRHEYPFGATLASPDLDNVAGLADLFLQHFNAITDEYEQKWPQTEPQQGQFAWDGGDAIYDFAVQNDLGMRGHDIFAEGGGPDWLANLPADGSANSVQAAIWQRLNDYIERYDKHVINYDVVNEITHFNKMITLLPCKPNGEGCMCQYKPACAGMALAINTPWWTWAWAATKHVLTLRGSGNKGLYQNDYCTASFCGAPNGISNMVRLQPIVGNTGYGNQLHQGLAKGTCGFDLHMRIDESTRATPGTDWWFTEFDINDPDVLLRADGYEMGYLAGFSHPKNMGITLWGWAKETVAFDQDARPYTSLLDSLDTLQFNPAGDRVLGDDGLLQSTFKSTYTQAIPATGGTMLMNLFKGDYQVALGGCTANFKVLSDLPLQAGNLKWTCPAGAPAAATARVAKIVEPTVPVKKVMPVPPPRPDYVPYVPPPPTSGSQGTNSGGDPYDPYAAPADPYAPPADPYAAPADPYAPPADPYAPPADPYAPPPPQ
ncbi:glycoside hydrolase superfamily [Tribonema minus]|uniref:Glycoside hydrolase superfamily n=1 Tax=Tribonema minus TaxID=303371 RepID=A0A835YTF7_9STRA|nr:glycoside hydrolase superfamily [Tribonema minus]